MSFQSSHIGDDEFVPSTGLSIYRDSDIMSTLYRHKGEILTEKVIQRILKEIK